MCDVVFRLWVGTDARVAAPALADVGAARLFTHRSQLLRIGTGRGLIPTCYTHTSHTNTNTFTCSFTPTRNQLSHSLLELLVFVPSGQLRLDPSGFLRPVRLRTTAVCPRQRRASHVIGGAEVMTLVGDEVVQRQAVLRQHTPRALDHAELARGGEPKHTLSTAV